MDITEVILHQHAEQRRMFTVLEEWPRDDEDGLDALWKRLEILLEVHAEAEERFFYPELVKLGEGAGDADSVEEEVEDAIKDHNEIRDAVRATQGKAERQDLTDFRQKTTLALRHGIAVQFLRFEAEHWATGVTPVDKDPEEFVEENEPDS